VEPKSNWAYINELIVNSLKKSNSPLIIPNLIKGLAALKCGLDPLTEETRQNFYKRMEKDLSGIKSAAMAPYLLGNLVKVGFRFYHLPESLQVAFQQFLVERVLTQVDHVSFSYFLLE
jgi:hypothetical protein